MIALAQQPFQPSEQQKAIKKILEKMTGLGVRIVPFVAPIGDGVPTVNYTFKAGHADPNASSEVKAAEIHAFHDYIKKLVMTDTGAGYDQLSIAHTSDTDDRSNSMWPCVTIRLSDVMGLPFSGNEALRVAKQLQHDLLAHVKSIVTPAQLPYYHKQLRQGSTFKDAYANELGM